MVLGIRGIPNVQGGVETHAERLYERLSKMGCDIEVLVRSPFSVPGVERFGAVKLTRLWSPRTPGLEAMVHSLLGVLYAGIRRPDILHVHAIGPAVVTPLAKLLGLCVVFTHHGPDYDRDKWGKIARMVLRLGERWGVRHANGCIVISKVIEDLVKSLCRKDSYIIPNGVVSPLIRKGTQIVRNLGLEPGKYFLQVSRIVPEKCQLDLIKAFQAVRVPGWKLALVGGIDQTDYCKAVQQMAASDPNVVLAGFRRGDELAEIYSHAGVFVLPSTHEGLPIVVLEALSYGLTVVASNIPANLEIGLEEQCYFAVGDVEQLSQRLLYSSARIEDEVTRADRRRWVTDRYDWDRIAHSTLDVYRNVLSAYRKDRSGDRHLRRDG